MPTFDPIRPIGPPPEHVLPRPGCVVYTEDGRNLWCTPGRLLITRIDSIDIHDVPLTLLPALPGREGWAFLAVATDGDGIMTSLAASTAAVYPATIRARPADTNFPGDAGTDGYYPLPLARLVAGQVIPILAGLPILQLYIDLEGVTETIIDPSDNILTFEGGKAATYTPWGP